MLLARFFNFFRDMKTLHVFLLEILAVFIGITGSLFVDNWRDEVAEREVLDHLLQETHYNALQDLQMVRRMTQYNIEGLKSTLVLAYNDLDEIDDDTLADHLERATTQDWWFELQPGYERLLNTSLSIPFDNTIAQLDWHFRNLRLMLTDLDDVRDRSEDDSFELARLAGRTPGLGPSIYLGIPADRTPEWELLLSTMRNATGQHRYLEDTTGLRQALRQESAKAVLRDLLKHRYDQQVIAIAINSTVQEIVQTIRRYDPDMTLPVESIGLIGDAAEHGWAQSITMQQSRSDPNVWAVDVSLVDGEIKFRADNDWSSDWGAPILPAISEESPLSFIGDVDSVFPTGQAQFKGSNIPVLAGRYRVTFNTQTFDYSFVTIDE